MKILQKIALIEGSTLLILLFIAVPLKRIFQMPELVSIIGPIHGIAFIVYFIALTLFFFKNKLIAKNWILGIILAFIPFGSFIFERKVLNIKT